ncbi:MAG: cache domain-containing protein, partial [Fibrobacteres bacterium]|nr:cache domain-containing protein [Fibrobacterota bacterium]
VWQWKDDSLRLEQKESYIRLFEPWGWVIGTGLYIHDVIEETARLKNKLLIFSFVIFGAVTFLLLIIIRAGLKVEMKRSQAEDLLLESTKRYKTLVDAATEGMILVRSRTKLGYANPTALELIGVSSDGVSLLELNDILPSIPENRIINDTLKSIDKTLPAESFSCLIKRNDGSLIECAITLQSTGGQSADGFLILLRRTSAQNMVSNQTSGILAKLLKLPSAIAQDIREEISNAGTKEEITALCLSAPALVQSLLDNGASSLEIARMLSSVTDAATKRLISLYEKENGTSPLPFAFVALGSQGRLEQTLFTDQDNAIIIASTENAELAESANRYCSSLASFVCAALIDSGYRRCKGAVMADNQQWCRPINSWKETFSDWILRADVKELMEFSIFFDFRTVYGDNALSYTLREHIHYRAKHAARFLPQMAQNALLFKSPIRLFGMVVTPQNKGDNTRLLDLKAASMPFTGFARLYALQNGFTETHTIDRVTELTRQGVLLPSKLEEFATAYTLLLRLRLRHQASIMQAGGTPDNQVNFASLGHIEQAVLRECFSEIDILQARIRRDFFGGE